MTLLTGDIANRIFAGFQGRLLTGTLRKTQAASVNDLGDPVSPTSTDYSCEGFVEEYDEVYRARADIPATDSKVNIFAKSLPDGIEPDQGDKVIMNGKTWIIRRARTDPATALWTCQSYVNGS